MAQSISSILEKILERKPQSLHDDVVIRTLNLDSLDVVTLIVEIDAEYGVTVSPEQIGACERIGNLAALVNRAKPARSSAA